MYRTSLSAGGCSGFLFRSNTASTTGPCVVIWLCLLLQASIVLDVQAGTRTKPLPANDAFYHWLQNERNQGTTAFGDSQRLAIGTGLAKARAQEMRALITTEPAQFVERAMPSAERD